MAKMKTYSIIGIDRKTKTRILPVKGELVAVKEFGDIELFIHKPLRVFLNAALKEYPFKYCLSEASTGRRFGQGNTKEDAIAHAIKRAKGCSVANIKEIMSKHLLDGKEHREVVK